VQVIPPRPTFAADMTGTKSEIMSKHVAYWTDWTKTSRWLVAEPSGLYGTAGRSP
jgi:hypothetical protein